MTASLWDQLDKVDPRLPKQEPDPVWLPVCVCGHPAPAHPAEQGGSHHSLPSIVMEGCIGAGRGRAEKMRVLDWEVQTVLLLATCPCREFRPVCEFDRPRRSCFWSAMSHRHPLLVALQAFRTSQLNRKDFDEEKAKAEVERRFRWLDGARQCAVKGCPNVSDVWPRYVDDDRNSELRCEEHTP